MKTVLITGGRGVLGSELTPCLLQAGFAVRGMSRRAVTGDSPDQLSWVQADLDTGEGLDAAVKNVDIIIHAASNPMQTKKTDLQGTEKLLAAAKAANIENFLYISIIGVDKVPFPYYKAKLAVEEMVKASGLPWSICRATQFHNLIDLFLGAVVRLPIMPLPTDFQFQTIDPGEVAEALAEQITNGAVGVLPSVTGPERIVAGEMARSWLKARGQRRWILPLRLPGKVAAGFRAGYTTYPAEIQGRITWSDWLARTYGDAQDPVTPMTPVENT